VEAATALSSPLGTITISRTAISQIVGRTAAECYGVVGMAARPAERLPWRDKLTQGVSVTADGDGLRIDVHVVVEYGLNLAEVGASLRQRVAYEVERMTGLTVGAVEVRIEDVRQ
jgi:uncharacterized alkaline shock family protein YloU